MVNMGAHEFGWIQNPSNFGKLKRTVQILVRDSPYYTYLLDTGLDYIEDSVQRNALRNRLTRPEIQITYNQMKGKAVFPKNYTGVKDRKHQVAFGLAQLSGGDNKKEKAWTDEWTAEGFLNWALTLHFFEVSEDTDLLSITELGKRFAQQPDGTWKNGKEKTYILSAEEKAFLVPVVMAYPPAVRFLYLLNNVKSDNQDTTVLLSKFKIGHELGFSGEPGFTSFEESEWFEYLHDTPQNKKGDVRSDVEGSADKWARTISRWLIALDLIKSRKLVRVVDGDEEYTPHAYQINGMRGRRALKLAKGFSRHHAIEKYVSWHMLATKVTNKNYVKIRRAYTLKGMQQITKISALSEYLKERGLFDGMGVLQADIQGLIRFGLNIDRDGGNIYFRDSVNNFEVPSVNMTPVLKDAALQKTKNTLLNELTEIDPADIEVIEMSWKKATTRSQNTLEATLFEVKVVEIFKKYFELNGEHLGGQNRPDGAVYYNSTYGIILDTKAYSNGYNIPVDQQREMVDYITDVIDKNQNVTPNRWWEAFPATLLKNNIYYLWVAGGFTGKYLDQLTRTHNQTNMDGGAMTTEVLLRLANKVSSGNLKTTDIPKLMTNKLILS